MRLEIVWNDVWVVRCIKGHVTQEGPGFGFVQEADGLVGEDLAGVGLCFFGFPQNAAFELAKRSLHWVGHAAGEHRACGLEAFCNGSIAVVPLSADEGGVAPVPEGFRPGRVAHQLFVDSEQGLSGEEHCPGGDACGALHAALHVGPPERHSGAGEFVEVGGLDGRVAVCGDGIGALVVRKEEEDVGPLGWGLGGSGGGRGGKQE